MDDGRLAFTVVACPQVRGPADERGYMRGDADLGQPWRGRPEHARRHRHHLWPSGRLRGQVRRNAGALLRIRSSLFLDHLQKTKLCANTRRSIRTRSVRHQYDTTKPGPEVESCASALSHLLVSC